MAGTSPSIKLPPIAPGQRYGLLVAIELVERASHQKSSVWRFKCDCGGETIAPAARVRFGTTGSCGCRKNAARIRNGHANKKHGLSDTPEYVNWINMMARCHDKKNPDFPLYGGRGIVVCDRWHKVENFVADMGSRPSPQHTIDRYPDQKGNYEPNNCRWATRKEQMRNMSRNRIVTVNGQEMSLVEACEILDLDYHAVAARIGRLGWSEQRALSVPAARRRS